MAKPGSLKFHSTSLCLLSMLSFCSSVGLGNQFVLILVLEPVLVPVSDLGFVFNFLISSTDYVFLLVSLKHFCTITIFQMSNTNQPHWFWLHTNEAHFVLISGVGSPSLLTYTRLVTESHSNWSKDVRLATFRCLANALFCWQYFINIDHLSSG